MSKYMAETRIQPQGIRIMDFLPDSLALIIGFTASLYLMVSSSIDDFKTIGAILGMFCSLGIQVYKIVEVKRIRKEIEKLKATSENTNFLETRLKQIEKKLETYE